VFDEHTAIGLDRRSLSEVDSGLDLATWFTGQARPETTRGPPRVVGDFAVLIFTISLSTITTNGWRVLGVSLAHAMPRPHTLPEWDWRIAWPHSVTHC